MVKKKVRVESEAGKIAPRDQHVENKLNKLREEYRKLHE
jgi:hypothetical protein